MPHFYIPPRQISDGRFTLSGSEVHHLLRVRRIAPGDILRLFDGTGTTYRARVTAARGDEIAGVILEVEKAPAPKVSVRLYQSVPRGERFDWLVEKAAELGVAAVVPVTTERSVVRDVSGAKVERWRRLARVACQQCGRPRMMSVEEPRPLLRALTEPGAVPGIIPWEGEETRTVEAALGAVSDRTIAVFIGPEGGFTPQEIEAAHRAGLIPVTLGERILRVETAGLLASILVLNHFEEFSPASAEPKL